MSITRVDVLTNSAGSGPVNFPNGYTTPTPPLFSANKNANQTITSGVATDITWPVEAFDLGNNFASDTFTAPSAGYYEFKTVVKYEPSAPDTITVALVVITKNGSAIHTIERGGRDGAASGLHAVNATVILLLAAADTIKIKATVTTLAATSVLVEGTSSGDTSMFQGRKLIGF